MTARPLSEEGKALGQQISGILIGFKYLQAPSSLLSFVQSILHCILLPLDFLPGSWNGWCAWRWHQRQGAPWMTRHHMMLFCTPRGSHGIPRPNRLQPFLYELVRCASPSREWRGCRRKITPGNDTWPQVCTSDFEVEHRWLRALTHYHTLSLRCLPSSQRHASWLRMSSGCLSDSSFLQQNTQPLC